MADEPRSRGGVRARWTDVPRMPMVRDIVVSPRPLLQYVKGDLYTRQQEHRTIGYDELFFDLVIVASLTVMGDDVRETFSGWASVERFVLLYATIISIWREATLLWNHVGTKRDAFEKVTIASIIVCLAGIALNASRAFRGSTGTAAVFAFLGHLVLSGRVILGGVLDPIRSIARVANGCAILVSALPYVIVPFVPDSSAKGLFWAAFALQIARSLLYGEAAAILARRWPDITLPATDVHALAERYGLITLIVFGETFISTIVEGNHVFQGGRERDVRIVLAVAISIVLVFSVHTLYFDVDANLSHSDKHALKRGRYYAIWWMLLHYPLHISLILAESALGIFVEKTGEDESSGGGGVSERQTFFFPVGEAVEPERGNAEGHGDAGGQPTDRAFVWLFCAAWATALASLILVSLMHKKARRYSWPSVAGLVVRCAAIVCLVTAVAIPSPGRLGPLEQIVVVAVVVGGTAALEFFLATYDHQQGDAAHAKEGGAVGGESSSDESRRDEESASAAQESVASATPPHHDHEHCIPSGIGRIAHDGRSDSLRRRPTVTNKMPFRGYSMH